MKTDFWMPLYIGDYLADTLHLSRSDHGSYILLIMAYWRNRGPLQDSESLRSICRCSETEWTQTRNILSKFFELDGQVWRHKRIDFELKRIANRSKAGKTGASARWQTTCKPPCDSDAKTMRNAWDPDPQPDPYIKNNKASLFDKTIQAVKAEFLKQSGSPSMAEDFFNHFESNGWKIGGKSPMVSLPHAVANWIKRSGNYGKQKPTSIVSVC